MNNINTGFEGHTNKPSMIKVNTFQEYLVNIIAINVQFFDMITLEAYDINNVGFTRFQFGHF